mgnify:CR=1 FL=1|jgi:hypothetical protein
MPGLVTYFIRKGCRWVKVSTSVEVWARLPHVTLGSACKLGGNGLALLLAGTVISAPPGGSDNAPIDPIYDPVPVAEAPATSWLGDAGAGQQPYASSPWFASGSASPFNLAGATPLDGSIPGSQTGSPAPAPPTGSLPLETVAPATSNSPPGMGPTQDWGLPSSPMDHAAVKPDTGTYSSHPASPGSGAPVEVPEPSAIVLLAGGVVALLRFRKI